MARLEGKLWYHPGQILVSPPSRQDAKVSDLKKPQHPSSLGVLGDLAVKKRLRSADFLKQESPAQSPGFAYPAFSSFKSTDAS
jgi:hypothetical protein